MSLVAPHRAAVFSYPPKGTNTVTRYAWECLDVQCAVVAAGFTNEADAKLAAANHEQTTWSNR